MYVVNTYILCLHSQLLGQLQLMHFETFILTSLFKNVKCKIEYQKKKKKATQVFQNFGSVGKGKQTSFFLGLNIYYKFQSQ